MRRLVGLTGGIGSGKSTVAGLLRAKGATVVDADEVARAVVEPGQPALAELVERFGDGILDRDGRLDRPKLAEIAFADEDGRKALGEITWPAIGEEFERQIREAPDDAIVVCDVPLLVESKAAAARPYVAVLVVEAPLDLRLARLELRGVPRDDAHRRMAAQATDEERREVATHVLDNGGDLESLSRQVDDVWADLLTREPPAPSPAPSPAEAPAASE
jgi:dephospho-CoA kinase